MGDGAASPEAGFVRDPRRWLRALRAFSFPLSILPVGVAAAAVAPWTEWRWAVLLACTAAVLALHSAGNLFNDYFDYVSGADSRGEDDEGRPGRLLVTGELTPRQVMAAALVCLALAAVPAAWLVWRCGANLLWFLVPGALALYAYTGPPFQLKSRALGEVVILVVFGPLIMAGVAYAQAGRVTADVLFLSVPIGMVTASVLAGNNLRDYEEDRAGGVATLAQRLGPRGQRIVYAAMLAGQTLGICAYGAFRGLYMLLAAPLLLAMLLPTLRRVRQGERVPDIDVRTARFGAALMLLAFAALLSG